MKDKPDIVLFGISFSYSMVVPTGVFYGITTGAGIFSESSSLSVLLPVVWFTIITLGAMVLGKQLPTDSLLGGGIVGTIVGFWIFSALVGWSFVMFAVVAIAILAIILGSWLAYEQHRASGETLEPPYGTWRHLFLLISIPPIVLLFLLVVA